MRANKSKTEYLTRLCMSRVFTNSPRLLRAWACFLSRAEAGSYHLSLHGSRSGRSATAQTALPRLVESRTATTEYNSIVTTFSVAICTRNRSDLFKQTVLAVFGQKYPKHSYEVLVIDNGSTDDTPLVAAALAAQAPVRFRFFEEPQVGVSRARNKAAGEADFDYVAYVDDDTIPAPTWLAALSATIEEHGALVVGGRVEDVYEEGFEIPRWFSCKYLKGFFRVDYRGKFPDIFRIRYPLYIGAGNSAYARRLFEQIEFPSSFGPAGKRRIKGSETFVNLVLEMDDVERGRSGSPRDSCTRGFQAGFTGNEESGAGTIGAAAR